MTKISIVVPVYKAEDCLIELYNRLVLVCKSLELNYEIILINDNSPDKSWEVTQALAAKDSGVKGVLLTRNFGQHQAITAGLDICDGDWVVVMDCDLEDSPEDISKLYKKAMEGHSVVRAIRQNRQHSFLKTIVSHIFYKVFRLFSGLDYDGRSANFRIMEKSVVLNLRQYREGLRFFGALSLIAGHTGIGIEVEHGKRHAGKSSYNFYSLCRLALETILAYSNRPLYFMIITGFSMSSISFIYGGYVLWQAIFNRIVIQGWASLIIALSFSTGVILLSCGVLGLYIGKIYDEVKKRPLYLIGEKTWK